MQEITALEMHGTGTSLGDPIEIRAAVAVFKGAIQLSLQAGMFALCQEHTSSACQYRAAFKALHVLKANLIGCGPASFII